MTADLCVGLIARAVIDHTCVMLHLGDTVVNATSISWLLYMTVQ